MGLRFRTGVGPFVYSAGVSGGGCGLALLVILISLAVTWLAHNWQYPVAAVGAVALVASIVQFRRRHVQRHRRPAEPRRQENS